MFYFMSEEQFKIFMEAKQRKEKADIVKPLQAKKEETGYKEIGSTAYIDIKGVLLKERDEWLDWFEIPQTAYTDIAEQIETANNNNKIKDIVILADSGGGTVDGMFKTANIIKNSKKKVTAHVEDYACSACYALISQASEIKAKNEYCTIGSIGVVVSYCASDYIIDISSSNAPKKRPDPKTEEGKAIIKEGLDEWEDKFFNLIVKGRGQDKEYIKANYGKGGTFLSEKALNAKMIDKIGYNNNKSNTKEAKKMDLIKLKAEFPELYAQVKLEGKTEEKSRVEAHTIAAENGDLNYALECIADGTPFGAVQQAKHMAHFQKQLLKQDGENTIKALEKENEEPIQAKKVEPVAVVDKLEQETERALEEQEKINKGDM